MNGMDEPADALIETDEAVLAQVRKDLAQTYTRFMARMLAATLSKGGGGGGSMFERLDAAAKEPRDG